MMEFRILKQLVSSHNGEVSFHDYIVQKKFLWWWITERQIIGGGGVGPFLTSILRFRTIESAREHIEDRRPKKHGEIVLVETRVIL